MYHEDCYATPAVMGDATICPNPTSEAAQARIFNNVAAMLREVFTYARAHLGFKTAVGTEAPRPAFFTDIDTSAESAESTYEAVFRRVEKAYPIDYWWTWTPEGFIWNEGSGSPVDEMTGAPVLASTCPNPGGSGTWSNTWTLVKQGDSSTLISLQLSQGSPLHPGEWCLTACNSSLSVSPGITSLPPHTHTHTMTKRAARLSESTRVFCVENA